MGVSYEKIDLKNTREVIHPGHPAVIDTALLADKTKLYKAGTIMTLDDEGEGLVPADPEDADIPVAVLAQDSDGKNAEVLVCWHGTVVFSRLLDASGSGEPVAATLAFANKLRAAGIYPLQLFANAKKG